MTAVRSAAMATLDFRAVRWVSVFRVVRAKGFGIWAQGLGTKRLRFRLNASGPLCKVSLSNPYALFNQPLDSAALV